ncbi:U4/U6 small nuclear ribonucleoprotein Prp31-like, partial [Passer montanus]|uniref:U4/U6 small nuclear ribonucleoprotein Prp31-like n=1 Tax=Passer montanus TaxID=9160 RepID=UPI001960AF78
ELGNSLDKCKNNENVQQILTNATIMVVSVTASTTQGQQLSEESQNPPKILGISPEFWELPQNSQNFLEFQVGYELKEEIERKFDKWQEPPPVKQVKPLPAPLDGQRKKRGGRRYRKMKERLGLTEIRKQANRMSFGEIEEDAYQEDLGFSLGHLGKAGSGRVRQTQVNEATKARISKTLQRTLQKQSVVYGGKSTIRDRSSGTASSVAFTPLQVGRAPPVCVSFLNFL